MKGAPLLHFTILHKLQLEPLELQFLLIENEFH